MPLETRSPAVLRFGTFEVDLYASELRKQGVRIKLQEQPFHVLTALLLHPGKVVTREDLRAQLWSADTFVDFDNSLNTSINKLREALGDSAESPRFIETLPRRGYRFISPVSSVDGKAKAAAASRGWKLAILVGALAAATVAGGLYWRSRQARRLTDKDAIVLADFTNTTGDPVFDGTLRAGLSVELEQFPILNLLPEEQIRETLRMMSQKSDPRLSPEIAREVCQRTNSAAALEGAIGLIGTRYNLILKAIGCGDGRVLASAEEQANDKSHVLDALGKVASEMRRKLGESLNTLQKYNTPLERATTPSLEALQSYSWELRPKMRGRTPQRCRFSKELSSSIRILRPLMTRWGTCMALWGRPLLAAHEIEKAFELRTGLSDWERLGIEADYYISKTGDLVKGRQVCEQGTKLYAGSAKQSQVAFQAELGEVSKALGQYDMGLKESLQALRLRPNTDALLYRGVLRSYLSLDRVKEAEAVAEEARAKGLDSHLGGVLYGLAFYRDDSGEMAQQVARVTGVPGEEDLLLALEADTAAYFGHLESP